MVVGKPLHPEARRDLGRQARADGAVRVADIIGELHPLAALEQRLGVAQNLRVEAVGHRVAEARPLRAALIVGRVDLGEDRVRSEEHTSELQSLMRISYAVFCLKKKKRDSTK